MTDYLPYYRRTRHPGYAPGTQPYQIFNAAMFGTPVLWVDFSDISTLFQDTAGSSPVTADGQTIARANDKSGNGNNITQSTAGSRPTYKASIQNGLSIARFSNHFLKSASFAAAIATPFDFLIVLKVTTYQNYEFPINSLTSQTFSLVVDAAGIRMYNGSNLQVDRNLVSKWLVIRGTFNGGSSLTQLCRCAEASGTTGSTGSMNGLTLGADASTSYPFVGDIGEIVLYSGTMTSANRGDSASLLQTKWDVPC